MRARFICARNSTHTHGHKHVSTHDFDASERVRRRDRGLIGVQFAVVSLLFYVCLSGGAHASNIAACRVQRALCAHAKPKNAHGKNSTRRAAAAPARHFASIVRYNARIPVREHDLFIVFLFFCCVMLCVIGSWIAVRERKVYHVGQDSNGELVICWDTIIIIMFAYVPDLVSCRVWQLCGCGFAKHPTVFNSHHVCSHDL